MWPVTITKNNFPREKKRLAKQPNCGSKKGDGSKGEDSSWMKVLGEWVNGGPGAVSRGDTPEKLKAKHAWMPFVIEASVR